jgi:phage terminase small subunit
MPGRRPTPIPIAHALGNPGKRRLKTEPKIRKLRPKFDQAWLDQESHAFLERHVAELERAGLLSVVDGPALALLADRWAELLAHRELVRTTGLPRAIALGYVNAYRRAEDSFRKWSVEYGFTALARTRLASADDEGPADEEGLDEL